MTAKQARELSEQYLREDREYVDDRIREACGRGHYKVWVQDKNLTNAYATKEYYRSVGFEVKEREAGSVKVFLVSWEKEEAQPE